MLLLIDTLALKKYLILFPLNFMQVLPPSRPGTDFSRFLLHILPLCFTGYHESMLHGPAEAVPGMPQILHSQITLNLKSFMCNTTTGLLRTHGHITGIECYFYFNKRRQKS